MHSLHILRLLPNLLALYWVAIRGLHPRSHHSCRLFSVYTRPIHLWNVLVLTRSCRDIVRLPSFRVVWHLPICRPQVERRRVAAVLWWIGWHAVMIMMHLLLGRIIDAVHLAIVICSVPNRFKGIEELANGGLLLRISEMIHGRASDSDE